MKFISKLKTFPSSGAHTLIKNETDKNVVFFYNNAIGGFKFKLLNPKEEITIQNKYKFFLIFRGNNPMYTYYTGADGENKIGILYNDFTVSDRKLLNTFYVNELNISNKQSIINIQEDTVLINEKS